MNSAASLIEANGLAFACHPVEANPFMPQDSSDLRHFLCSFSGAAVPAFEFYVSFGEGVEASSPDAETALSLVLEDVRAFRECGGYGDFARLIGIDEDDPAGAAGWDELARLAPAVEALSEQRPLPSSSI